METHSKKPKYLVFTDKLGFKLPIFWCVIALIVGIFLHDISSSLFIPVMSLLLTWVCFKSTSFLLSFQKHSGIVSNSIFDNILKFIWLASIISFIFSILNAAFQASGQTYPSTVFSIVYFGFSLAATNSWGKCYIERRV